MPPAKTTRAAQLFAVIEAHQSWIGLQFHLLKVKRVVSSRKVPQFWCLCVCGNEVVATASELAYGRARSCGHCQRKRSGTSVVKRRAGKR